MGPYWPRAIGCFHSQNGQTGSVQTAAFASSFSASSFGRLYCGWRYLHEAWEAQGIHFEIQVEVQMSNDGPETPTPSPLSVPRRKVVEFGLVHLQEIEQERDQFQKELIECRQALAEANVKIESLQGMVTIHQQHSEELNISLHSISDSFRSQSETLMLEAEQRIRKHRDERDQAIDDMNRYKVILDSLGAQLRAFEIESVPLIKGASEPEPE